MASPSPAGATGAGLNGVKVFSGTDAWAVGVSAHSTGVPGRSMIQRWNGSSWSIVPSPSPDPTQNVLGPSTVWAAGIRAGSDFVFRTFAVRTTNG